MKIKSTFLSLIIIAGIICTMFVMPAMAANDDYWKSFANMYFEENFEGKTWSSTTYSNNTAYFADASGNKVLRYVSNNSTIAVVDDPTSADNDVLKISPSYSRSGPAFWYDQANLMTGWENLTDKFIYEQKYYLTSDALKNGGYLMWQVYDSAGANGRIAFVAWDTGFNTTVANNTATTAYTLPRNEWFTIRGELDFVANTIAVYVIKADGTKTHMITNTMNSAIKKSGLGRMRVTYSENPAEGKNQSVYYDDIYYYTLDTSLATVPEGYLGMTGSGTATEVGSQLSVTPKFINNTAPYDYTIQWYRVDAGIYTYANAQPQAIEGATGETYTVTADDDGCYIFAKFIVKGSSIAEGMEDVELDTYPQQPVKDWAFNVGKGFFKEYRNIFFGEDFDDKAYSYTSNTANSGNLTFTDSYGNAIWRNNSAAMPVSVVADPAGRDGKSFKLAAEYVGNDASKRDWFDQYTDLKNDGLKGLYVYEQELYLDDNALKNGGHVMLQFMHTASTGQILYMIRDTGFNANYSDATPTVKYTLPRKQWFKLVTILDYQQGVYYLKLIKPDGTADNIMSASLNPVFKTNGTVRVRTTYEEKVSSSFSNANVYFDNVNYYSTDAVLANVANLKITGDNVVGGTLKATYDYVGDVVPGRDLKFQWYRADTKETWYFGRYEDGDDEQLGENFVAISGATGEEYELTDADKGKYIKLEAVFNSPDGGTSTMWTHPQFIRPFVEIEITNPEITLSNGTGAAVYFENNNKEDKVNAVMLLAKYTGSTLSSVVAHPFSVDPGEKKTVRSPMDVGTVADSDILKLMVWSRDAEMMPLAESLEMKASDIRSIPKPVIKVTGDDIAVTWDGESILDIYDGRYLTFRSTIENDHWVGTKYNKGTDMGFSYQEDNICGVINESIETEQDDWSFKITLKGRGAIVDATKTNIIEGRWNPEHNGYEYKYTATMHANDTENYHKNSVAGWANTGMVEFLDYFLERMSMQDRTLNNNMNGDLYDYVAFTNGNSWERIPKLSVFYDYVRSGKYYGSFYLNKGDKIALVDANAAGWTSELLDSSADMRIGICWSWYDIHYFLENAVPLLGSCNEFEVGASWLFKPTSAEENCEIINSANEPDWRNNINYDLPRYSLDWNNKFDTQVGGTEWEDGMAWSRTDYDCYWDKEVGYDDNFSVAFDRDASSKTASTWFNSCYFGNPGDFFLTRGKTYRVSAMVKTENLTGEAKLSVVNGQGRFAIPGYSNGDAASDKLQYVYADSLTGTNDWTPVSLEFTGVNGNARFYLTYIMMTATGEGKAWFDNVTIEEITK